MTGIARSGKSTWVRKFKGDAVVVCPDTIRKMIYGHQFHTAAEDYIWAMAKAMARLLLLQGKSVALDATLVVDSFREPWLKIAKEYGARTRLVWMGTTVEECQERNRMSVFSKRVPAEVLERMHKAFMTPSPRSADEVLLVLTKKRGYEIRRIFAGGKILSGRGKVLRGEIVRKG
jgi:predicted kinase